ncbi:ATP-binding protein [Gracilibacillus oryzae]|uniref:ATP-binding protein n=1 Tax=Gracilibacillus oryzae TaxID=1672701 RepID=A0A7C8L0K0_9BACI|nr:AAA family ATPase [Gracilibacillus oryzae]KAB8138150.1 ATP-binding protein [Gracilibacillus oryzae]
MDRRNVYIISGPAGVGKSTTSKELLKKLKDSAYISGDAVSHMHIGGRQKPWESKKEISLIWDNILCLTRNFLSYGNDVVIDYVTFPSEANWLFKNIIDLDVSVHYVVLWTDKETLLKRDLMRKKEYQMGDRCLILVDEFLDSGLDEKFRLPNCDKEPEAVIGEILNNGKFRLTESDE